MVTKELSEAAVEINSIFENMSIDLLQKIPLDIKNFLKEIESKEYKFEYDKSIELDKQKLLPKTKGILAAIYRDYVCDEEERELYNKECNRVLAIEERKKAEKYNPEDIFKNKKTHMEKEVSNKEILPIEYKKESLFKRIMIRIKEIFKKAK